MIRPSWDEYWIQIASDVAKRGTCLRRVYGAVIVKDNRIISTGYCGAPVGEPNCIDLGVCKRQELGIPSGERYELCRSVHAEANAIIQGDYDKMNGATIYISGWEVNNIKNFIQLNPLEAKYAEASPCMMCDRMIKNAKIERIVWRKKDGTITERFV